MKQVLLIFAACALFNNLSAMDKLPLIATQTGVALLPLKPKIGSTIALTGLGLIILKKLYKYINSPERKIRKAARIYTQANNYYKELTKGNLEPVHIVQSIQQHYCDEELPFVYAFKDAKQFEKNMHEVVNMLLHAERHINSSHPSYGVLQALLSVSKNSEQNMSQIKYHLQEHPSYDRQSLISAQEQSRTALLGFASTLTIAQILLLLNTISH